MCRKGLYKSKRYMMCTKCILGAHKCIFCAESSYFGFRIYLFCSQNWPVWYAEKCISVVKKSAESVYLVCSKGLSDMQKGYIWNAERVYLDSRKGLFCVGKVFIWNAERVFLECRKGIFVTQKGSIWNAERVYLECRKGLFGMHKGSIWNGERVHLDRYGIFGVQKGSIWNAERIYLECSNGIYETDNTMKIKLQVIQNKCIDIVVLQKNTQFASNQTTNQV